MIHASALLLRAGRYSTRHKPKCSEIVQTLDRGRANTCEPPIVSTPAAVLNPRPVSYFADPSAPNPSGPDLSAFFRTGCSILYRPAFVNGCMLCAGLGGRSFSYALGGRADAGRAPHLHIIPSVHFYTDWPAKTSVFSFSDAEILSASGRWVGNSNQRRNAVSKAGGARQEIVPGLDIGAGGQ